MGRVRVLSNGSFDSTWMGDPPLVPPYCVGGNNRGVKRLV